MTNNMLLPESQNEGLPSRFVKGGVSPDEGMLRFTGNEELDQQDEESREAMDAQTQPVILNLAGEIRTKWGAARDSKQDIQTQMEKSLRQRKGEYDSDDLARIQAQGGSEVFINITNVKCRAAESWVYDLLLPPGERPWAVKPTPLAELPGGVEEDIKMGFLEQIQGFLQMNMSAGIPVDEDDLKKQLEQLQTEVLKEVKVKAASEAEKMEDEIDDDLVEGGWYQALRDCVPDIVTLPAGIIEGPTVKMKKKLKWSQYPDGTPMAQTVEEPQRTYQRVSPFDIYPSPGSKSLQDGYLCHHIRFERKDLNALIGVEGFDEDAIRLVLQEYGQGGLREWLANDIARAEIENRPPEFSRNAETSIDCIKFMGAIQGIQLLNWGMSVDEVPDSLLDYEITAYLIGEYIIGATLNKHPLGRRTYFSASFEQSNTSIWGKGIPELMEDIQKICNGCGRAMVNNMSMACLTGDTIVYRYHKNGRGYSELTLNEIFDKKENHNSGLRRIKLRSLDERKGDFYLNRIVDIHDNGIAPVYEVLTENGYRIKATLNHRFMTSSGDYDFLSNFNTGDDIAVNGRKIPRTKECIDCGCPITAKAMRCKKCHTTFHNNNQVEAAENNICNPTTARARRKCKEARLGFCEVCGSERIIEVHHKDRSPWNNEPENLINLCNDCHKYEHKRHDNFGNPFKHKYLDYDKIIRIKYMGEERVFDLQMEHPDHNFVANGFVSHNSGPQVTILTNLLAEGETMTSLIPWKIWRMVHKGDGSSQRPPVEFFQPDSIVDQLLSVYEYFFKQASEVTGIPSYVYGSGVEAHETASGLSMLLNAASKGLKAVASHIDVGIIKPSIEETWLHIMIYEPEKARGDISIRARASEYLIMMEQLQIRRMEFLNSTNNQTDMEIIGTKGRAAVLKETVRALKMPVDDIVPDPDSIGEKQNNAKIQMMMANIAAAIGADPQQVMQIAMYGGQPQAEQPQIEQSQAEQPQAEQPQELAPSGDRAGGQDFTMAA